MESIGIYAVQLIIKLNENLKNPHLKLTFLERAVP